MLPVDAITRRAKLAGIAGWLTIAMGLIGFATYQPLRYLWIAIGFIGPGGVLRGAVLVAIAARLKHGRSGAQSGSPRSGSESER